MPIYLTAAASLMFLMLTTTFSEPLLGQETFDKGLSEMSETLSKRIGTKNIKRVAVLKFIDQGEHNDALAEYIAEEMSVYLTNNNEGFDVYDRHYLAQVLDEHKLNMSGIIDESTAKQVGEFSGADALVVGRFSILGDFVKIWVKVIDTQTAMQIAAENATLPIDKTTRLLINSVSTQPAPLPSPNSEDQATKKESYEQASASNSLCFVRNSPGFRTHKVIIYDKNSGAAVEQLTMAPKGRFCMYDLKDATYIVRIYDSNNNLMEEYQVKAAGGNEIVKQLPG
jgi:hypothetical protein